MNAGSAAVSTGKFGRAVMRLGGMCHRAPVVELLAWLERLHAQPLIREGADIGFVKIVRDMTEVHEAQERLLETETRFRQLVEGVVD